MLSLHFKIDFPVSIKYAATLKCNFSGTLWKETGMNISCLGLLAFLNTLLASNSGIPLV